MINLSQKGVVKLILIVLNYPSGDLSSSVCELELPGCLAIRVIWERAVKVFYSQSTIINDDQLSLKKYPKRIFQDSIYK